MKLAFLYAGQGSQCVGMGKDFYQENDAFRTAFDSADLPFDYKSICFEDPQEQLSDTRYTQPCMVAFACGITAALAQQGIVPQAVAGLSLGEYSALQAAGVFTAKQAIELVAFRGNVMAQAVQNRPSGMAAILGMSRDDLLSCCQSVQHIGICEIANYNCPGQLVIAGDSSAVEVACQVAKQAGAKRCVPLNVSGPFHTSLMAPAAQQLKQRFAQESFGEMQVPVIFNCLGKPKTSQQTVAQLLEQQVQSSVYFEDTILWLQSQGFDTIVEIGPGKTLSGFVKKTAKEIRTFQVEDIPSFHTTLCALKGEQTP